MGHTATCRQVVLENIEQNAASDGQPIPAWGFTEADGIPGWGVSSIATLIDQYLEDGTATCECLTNDRTPEGGTMRNHESTIDGESIIFHPAYADGIPCHTADYVPDLGQVVLRHWFEDGVPCDCDGGSGVVDTLGDGDIVWHRAGSADEADEAAEYVFRWAAAHPCVDGARYAKHQHTYRADLSDWWCVECDTVTDYCPWARGNA